MIQNIAFDVDIASKNINIGAFKQYSINSINLEMNIVCKGKPANLESATHAIISIRRPDGTTSNSFAFLEGNTVHYLLEPNAISQIGVHHAELQINGGMPTMQPMSLDGGLPELSPAGGQMLVTSTFYYDVQKSIYNDQGITEQEGYPALIQLAQIIDELMKYVNTGLLQFERTNLDENGIFTTLVYKRQNNKLFSRSILSGTSPEYSTRTVTYYADDGATVRLTVNYTLTYSNGKLVSQTIQGGP